MTLLEHEGRVERGGSYRIRCVCACLALVVVLAVSGAFWYATCGRKLVLVVLALFGAAPLAVLALHSVDVLSSEARRLSGFAAVLACSCVLFAVLFPPFSVADEFHHYLSSYWLSDCVAGSAAVDRPETIEMRRDDWELYSDYGRRDDIMDYQTFTIDAASYQKVADEFSWARKYEGVHEVPEDVMFNFTLGGENVVAKVGSVAGMLLGRLLDLGAYPLFYLGRICSAFFYVVCVVAAVKLTPVGKNAMMVTALLPMTLQEAASYSYDGGTIGLSFLFLALVCKAIFEEGLLGRGTLVALTILSALLAPCKAIYVLEVGLVLLIPVRRFSSTRMAVVYKLMVLGIAAVALLVMRLPTISAVSSGTSTSAFPGERTYALSELVSNPLGTVALFLRTFEAYGDSYWMSAIGSNLGWLQGNLGTSAAFMAAYVFVLLYSSQRASDDRVKLNCGMRAAFLGVAALVWLAAMLSMAVSWTPNTASVIQGVQGRYILPALPLLLLGLRSGRAFMMGRTFPIALVCVLTLNALYMVRFMALALAV